MTKNSEFLSEVYGGIGSGHFGWVCSFAASPQGAPAEVWQGRAYRGTSAQADLLDRSPALNNYYSTAILRANDDGEVARRKSCFVRLAALVMDDVAMDDVQKFSYAIETSPGNFQIGILLDPDDPDCADAPLVDQVMQQMAATGRSNDASGNGAVRYVRLPCGANTKPRPGGIWDVLAAVWMPSVRLSLADACAAFEIDLDALRSRAEKKKASTYTGNGSRAGSMITSLLDPLPSRRDYHDNLRDLAASFVSTGMQGGAAVEMLRSIMDAGKPTDAVELARWQARYLDIPRMVSSAEKFAPSDAKFTINIGKLGGEKKAPSDIAPMDWAALATRPATPVQWALDHWLPVGHVTLLSANGGVGKSTAALQLGIAITRGEQWMGVDTTQGRVLVISAEDGESLVHSRVASICEAQSVRLADLSDLIVYDLSEADSVLWREGQPTQRMQWLADTVDHHAPAVVILDNASDLFADNENDRSTVRGFMRALKLIASANDCAVLMLAHVDKASVRNGGNNNDTTFSGSTGWNNSARSRWAMVAGESNAITLRHEKSNLGPRADAIELEFDSSANIIRLAGTTPGQQAATALVRNAQRIAIARLIGQASDRGVNLSSSPQAPQNIYRVLCKLEGFPRVTRAGFFALLHGMQVDGWIEEAQIVKANRHKTTAIVLTDAGRNRVAYG